MGLGVERDDQSGAVSDGNETTNPAQWPGQSLKSSGRSSSCGNAWASHFW